MTNPFGKTDEIIYPTSFSVIRRNYGHWDVTTRHGRAFRIRGGPGSWSVFDERALPGPDPRHFKDQGAAMAFICSEMMHELIIAEGQQPTVVEGWNVPRDNPHLANSQMDQGA